MRLHRLVVAILTLWLIPLMAAATTDEPPPDSSDGGRACTKTGPTRTWSKPSETEIKAKLSPLQYRVTQEDATEPPFRNDYWDHHGDGIYVDVVSGEPLFRSRDKFDSGTGWPSFHTPLEPSLIVERKDRTLWMTRTEVRSRFANSHLGHVFDDGPGPSGLRYCINSASLRFIPAADLEREGYGEYAALFRATGIAGFYGPMVLNFNRPGKEFRERSLWSVLERRPGWNRFRIPCLPAPSTACHPPCIVRQHQISTSVLRSASAS